MIKAVFFDIDGTLVTDKVEARASTKKAISILKGKGIICGIATGRGPVRIHEHIDGLKMDIFVTYNGQYVYTDKKIVYENAFSPEVVREIALYAEEENLQLIFGSKNEVAGSSLMLFGQNAWAKRLQQFIPKGRAVSWFKAIAKKYGSLSRKKKYSELAILKEPIYQCVLVSPESEGSKLEKLGERFPQCKFTRSNPFTVDVIPKGGSKIIGIEKAGNELGFSIEEVMAFGDSWNDREMLDSVEIGIAMGNANEDIKVLADFVTDLNTEDGILKGLLHFGIIQNSDLEERS